MRFHFFQGLGFIAAVSLSPFCRADGYGDWQTVHFSGAELSNTAIGGESADPDGDGIPNLLEYIEARDPKASDSQASSASDLFNGRLTLTFRERDSLGGASIWLQGSDDLNRWTTYNTRQESARVANTGFSTVTLLDPKELPYDLGRRFLRLRADRSPAALAAPNKVAVDFISPTELYAVWGDPNTSEIGYKVTHYDYTYGYRVVAEKAPDITKASGLTATPQTGYNFFVSTIGAGSVTIQSNWVTPPDRDGDGIPDYLERRGQTIITGTYNSDPDSWDTDGDGLSDNDEIAYYGTDPSSNDSDNDGLGDYWEIQYGFNPLLAGEASGDPDTDGLTNLQESVARTDPYNPDTDYDGLSDSAEVNIHLTNPTLEDTDGDGLNDAQELNTFLTNPLVVDTDGDGLPDGWEVTYQLNPLNSPDGAIDSDGDTLSNLVEYNNNTSPRKTDTDNDGLSDDEEVNLGTRGSYWDSDNDGMSDRFEILNDLNPNNYADGNVDSDSDSLSNWTEYKAGTNPKKIDTDGDGFNDAAEINNGADPTDSSDAGQAPPPEQQVPFSLQIVSTGKTLVGNCAVCHNLQAQVGGRLISDSEVLQLRRDKAYEIKLIDKLTEWSNSGGSPPHDTTARFTLWPKVQSGQVLTSSANGQQLTVTKNGALEYFVDNSADLLAEDKVWNDNLLQKTATVGLADVDVIHPATGELDEDKEDGGDGGYVPIKRAATTPVTQLKLHARPAFAAALYRLKFNSGGRYKLYRDAARTDEVISETTQFSPATDVSLYFEGISKSTSRGGEKVTVQIQLNGQWLDADAVLLTVVQAEFPIFIRAYIPYLWTTPEDIFWTTSLLTGQNVAGGDNRNINLDPGNDDYRLMQSFTLTPYPDLHVNKDIETDRTFSSAQQSISYKRSTSVPAEDMDKLHGYSLRPNPEFRVGTPQGLESTYVLTSNGQNKTKMQVTGSGEDGAIYAASFWGGWQIPSMGVPNIDWNIKIELDKTNPIQAKVSIEGQRNKFPAYEIIGLKSDNSWMELYHWQPPCENRAGPISLNFNDEIAANKTIQ
jgi:hypothetical protein